MTAGSGPVASGRQPRFGPVAWLTAQAIAFGAWAALLGIVANAMFLEAYGSEWLPVTYIVIGVAGIAVSAAIRRAAQRFDLLRLAVVVLGGAAVMFAVAWLLAGRPDGAWVSAPLLVFFPILIQLGFVFIGGQAGRVLDIGGIKASFARMMAGFPIGAVLGGLAAVPMVDWFARVEDLLLVTAAVQGVFAALVWATGRRYARLLAAPRLPASSTAADREQDRSELTLRRLVGRPLVAFLLAYQVLSALGSQLADFLVFDRASALLPAAEDLGRFVAVYTAAMNGIAIAFLFVLAGPMLRRYGLRLGTAAQPVVGLVFSVAILAVLLALGPASMALLAIVSGARIADIALTDGMTRTSINAVYQVVPVRQRLAAQATVEGMGVPVAIGLSGVLILVINLLPEPLGVRVVVLALVCAAWAWSARRLYREYGAALIDVLRSGRLVEAETALHATPGDAAAVSALLQDPDPNVARLGQELAAGLRSTAFAPGLLAPTIHAFPAAEQPAADARAATLAGHLDHPDRSLGLAVLQRLAAPSRAEDEVRPALEALGRADVEHARRVLEAILALDGEATADPDETVRRALREELALATRRIAAGLEARFGRDELGPALGRLARGAGGTALAAEALEVTLGPAEAAIVVALLDPNAGPGERLQRLERLRPTSKQRPQRDASAWLFDLAEDSDATWRSPWLRACAIRALRLAGQRPGTFSATSGALGATSGAVDPVVAEELALLAAPQR